MIVVATMTAAAAATIESQVRAQQRIVHRVHGL